MDMQPPLLRWFITSISIISGFLILVGVIHQFIEIVRVILRNSTWILLIRIDVLIFYFLFMATIGFYIALLLVR